MNIRHEIIKRDYTIRCNNRGCRGTPHWHQRLELLLVKSGRYSVTVRRETVEAKPGDVFVIQSGVIHSIQSLEEDGNLYVCTFRNSVLRTVQTAIPPVRTHIPKAALEAKGIYDRVCHLFSEIHREMHSGETYTELTVPGQIQLLFGILARNFEGEASQGTMEDLPEFQRILSYISENFREAISLKDIAKQLNYSASYVSELFVSCTGVNFKTYLDSIRVHEAVTLLTTTKETISTVSTRCGFENIRTFNNTFRRITGQSPSQFRKGQ